MMESMSKRLETDAELAGAYAAAHDDYIAAGPGVNPLGDEALAELPNWWKHMPCE
jgi:hypothetical protein